MWQPSDTVWLLDSVFHHQMVAIRWLMRVLVSFKQCRRVIGNIVTFGRVCWSWKGILVSSVPPCQMMLIFETSFESQKLCLSGVALTVTFLWTVSGGTIGRFQSSSCLSKECIALGRGRAWCWCLPYLVQAFKLAGCYLVTALPCCSLTAWMASCIVLWRIAISGRGKYTDLAVRLPDSGEEGLEVSLEFASLLTLYSVEVAVDIHFGRMWWSWKHLCCCTAGCLTLTLGGCVKLLLDVCLCPSYGWAAI